MEKFQAGIKMKVNHFYSHFMHAKPGHAFSLAALSLAGFMGISSFVDSKQASKLEETTKLIFNAPTMKVKYEHPDTGFYSYGNTEKVDHSDLFWQLYSKRVRDLNPGIDKNYKEYITLPDVDLDGKVIRQH